MTDEQKYHRDSDADCIANVARELEAIAEKLASDNELSKKLWPHGGKTWFRIEAERLREINNRWLSEAI